MMFVDFNNPHKYVGARMIDPYILNLSNAELKTYVAQHLRVSGSFNLGREKLLAIAQAIYNQRVGESKLT